MTPANQAYINSPEFQEFLKELHDESLAFQERMRQLIQDDPLLLEEYRKSYI
jgi:hypothetical protein